MLTSGNRLCGLKGVFILRSSQGIANTILYTDIMISINRTRSREKTYRYDNIRAISQSQPHSSGLFKCLAELTDCLAEWQTGWLVDWMNDGWFYIWMRTKGIIGIHECYIFQDNFHISFWILKAVSKEINPWIQWWRFKFRCRSK